MLRAVVIGYVFIIAIIGIIEHYKDDARKACRLAAINAGRSSTEIAEICK